MSSGDETYLEAFVETLSTLPYQLRRNLELVQDLDRSYQHDMARLHTLHASYVKQVEEKVLQLEVAPTTETGATGVRVIRKDPANAPVTIPTTAEFMDYTRDESEWQQIQKLQADCRQKADEKVAVSNQAYEWIDDVVQRLDDDLLALSKMLQAQGEFHEDSEAQPNELAACQVGSEWILAKVLEQDPKTGIYKLVDEDVEQSNKIFHLAEEHVVILRPVERLSKGDVVFAVYPDTTSFYQATVVQVPRKSSGSQAFVMVNFVDDSDEFGVTHDKAVQLQYIMLPPIGAVIK